MEPQVWAAVIAAAASLVVALTSLVTSWRTQKRSTDSLKDLEELKDELAEKASERDAWLAYQFEARKRLYEECAPLLFALSERSERALGQIYGLARTAAAGDLDEGKSWLSRGYYSNSTYYRLIAPLSVGRLFRHRLTHLDLSIDPIVHWQYTLVRVLMDTFTDDFELAGRGGEVDIARRDWIEYDPHAPAAVQRRLKEPEKYWQQGIPRGYLEDAVTALIVNEERVMEFREFQTERDNLESEVHRAFSDRGADPHVLADRYRRRSLPALAPALMLVDRVQCRHELCAGSNPRVFTNRDERVVHEERIGVHEGALADRDVAPIAALESRHHHGAFADGTHEIEQHPGTGGVVVGPGTVERVELDPAITTPSLELLIVEIPLAPLPAGPPVLPCLDPCRLQAQQ